MTPTQFVTRNNSTRRDRQLSAGVAFSPDELAGIANRLFGISVAYTADLLASLRSHLHV